MINQIIHIVIKEGEIVFVSTSKEEALDYVDNQCFSHREAILNEWGNDDPSYEDIASADFQAGIDGDIYQIFTINLPEKTNYDTIEIDGEEFYVSEILKLLKKSEKDEY